MNVPDTYPELFWGYLVIWLLIIAYVFYLGRKVARLEKMNRTDDE